MRRFLIAVLPLTLAAGSPPASSVPPKALPNPQLAAAGSMRDGVLSITLDAQMATWHPDGDSLPGIVVEAFGEPGAAPLAPGPLIRVPLGTAIHATVRNSLARDTLILHFHLGATPDSIVVPSGEQRELRTTPARAGTFLYKGYVTRAMDRTAGFTGLLHGALVVDSAGATMNDRIFVISGAWDALIPGTRIPLPERSLWTINGLSWPHTERFTFTAGDTVRWRIVNATADQHPMHLHGFYFRVTGFDGPAAALREQGPSNRMVVTERLAQLTTMSLTWVPERAGNWLFHCHFQEHIVPHGALSDGAMRIGRWRVDSIPSHDAAHGNHAMTAMAGLVLGIHVRSRPGAVVAQQSAAEHRLRMVAMQDSGFPPALPSLRFHAADPQRAGQAELGPGISPTLHVVRGVPASVTVVNRMQEPTAVHWHGIELESFHDGVAGFGGSGGRTTPIIAPSDSFEARFTPPRAGTFIYHSHVDELRQHAAGLVGALIVHEGKVDTANQIILVVKSARSRLTGPTPIDINGRINPDTLVLKAGQRYLIRLVAIQRGLPILHASLTARSDSSRANTPDSLLMTWRPLAKDGWSLPDAFRVLRPATQSFGMGETFDFEFAPTTPTLLRFEIRSARGLVSRVPIRVTTD